MSGIDLLNSSERSALNAAVDELQRFVSRFEPGSNAIEESEAAALNKLSPNKVVSITDRFRSPGSFIQSLGAILELGFVEGCEGYLIAKIAFSQEDKGNPDFSPASEVTFTCPTCQGDGYLEDNDCDDCGGEGELLFELNWDDAGLVYPEFVSL